MPSKVVSADPIIPFAEAFQRAARDTEECLERLLPSVAGAEDPAQRLLYEAMQHAALGPGKRFRAYLALAGAEVFHVPRTQALRVACAVECLHAYSLVHDDLPAMDDADLRRGQPSTHRAFGEPVAILAGDALHSLAFEILADPATHPDGERRARLCHELAQCVGSRGMVGGQMMDLHPIDDAERVRVMQEAKTGALIRFCCRAGGVLGAKSEAELTALGNFGDAIGLAFQIRDDLLDLEADASETGKPTGTDSAAGKVTLVAARGATEARELAGELLRQAPSCLELFGGRASVLSAAVGFVMDRKK